MAIKKDTLHPEGEVGVDIYPKTSIDQVENLQANLDALNGDIANANGEISAISNRVNVNEKNITDLQNDVNQNTRDISSLYTAYNSYSDYSVVTTGFLLSYVSGRQIELPIKAGTNVTFSKYPGSNQIVINATGGNGRGDVYTSANNTFTGNNYFNGQVICANNKGLDIKSGVGTYRFIGLDNDCGITIIKPDLKIYRLVIPDKNGTLSTVEDIPISLMYSSSRLGENSVDFPFNIDKNYFFTITMTNTGESKSFIYAKGTSSTYTIVINSSTSFEVKLNATGSSTRLIFTNKSNADPFVVRAEISN